MVITSKHGDPSAAASSTAIVKRFQEKFHKIFKDYKNGVDKVRRSGIIPVFRRYKAKNGAKTQINGYASFLFVFQLSNNW